MSAGLAVVTGGAGFLGRHLVAALRSDGTQVRVLDLAPRPAGLASDVDYRQMSILDRDGLRTALTGVDELYHLAAIAHLWTRRSSDYGLVNREGTRLVLEAAADAKVARIVVTSTEILLRGWRDPNPAPVTEADRPAPLPALAGPYSRSKAEAHAIAAEAAAAGAPLRIVYPTVPVGPGDYAMTAPTMMIHDFLRGSTPAYLETRLNLVPVEDAARGHILAARVGEPSGRYLLGGENLWLSEVLALLKQLTGRPMPRRKVPFGLAHLAGMVSTLIADGLVHRAPKAPLEGVRLSRVPRLIDDTLSRRALGFAPGPVADALARQIAWLTAEGLVPARVAG